MLLYLIFKAYMSRKRFGDGVATGRVLEHPKHYHVELARNSGYSVEYISSGYPFHRVTVTAPPRGSSV